VKLLSLTWDRGRLAGVTWDSMRPACALINKTGAINRALQLKRALPAFILLNRGRDVRCPMSRRRGRPRSHVCRRPSHVKFTNASSAHPRGCPQAEFPYREDSGGCGRIRQNHGVCAPHYAPLFRRRFLHRAIPAARAGY